MSDLLHWLAPTWGDVAAIAAWLTCIALYLFARFRHVIERVRIDLGIDLGRRPRNRSRQ